MYHITSVVIFLVTICPGSILLILQNKVFSIFCQFRGFVMQKEFAKSAEIFKCSTFFVFPSWNLKSTLKYVKELASNAGGARDHVFMTSTLKGCEKVLKFVKCFQICCSFLQMRLVGRSQNWPFFVDVINVWPPMQQNEGFNML